MKILALTGGIASGKSTVARMFENLGALVIAADPLAHRVYRAPSAVFNAIVRRYGKKILGKRGGIDRAKLAAILFSSPKEKKWLEGKIHPAVFELLARRIKQAMRRRPSLILVEAALHVETGYYRSFQGLIVVHARSEQQIERLRKREGLSLAEARARLRNQGSERERLKCADWVVDNTDGLGKTGREVRRVFGEIF